METLSFTYAGGRPVSDNVKPVLVGVLGSGNLEVLVEPAPSSGQFHVDVTTAAVGFGAIWRAVFDDAFARWPLTNLRVAINDAGSTPAVVALRVDQALEEFLGRPA
jgi:malonate decarboxylase delta subunit